jgi:hypothetical protein
MMTLLHIAGRRKIVPRLLSEFFKILHNEWAFKHALCNDVLMLRAVKEMIKNGHTGEEAMRTYSVSVPSVASCTA